MKRAFILFLLLIYATGCGNNNSELKNSKPNVYTSIYPLYDFANKVGGDKINIKNLVPAGIEPHDWEPTPADIINLEKADIFIYNGAGMEHWVNKVLSSLQNENLVIVEASRAVNLIEDHHDEHEDEHQHESDPHVWLNPKNAKKQMELIKIALSQADKKNQAFYQSNYNKYSLEFDLLDKEFQDTLMPLTNKDIIVTHQAFGYLCEAYGLHQIAIKGLSPDSEPDSSRMSDIIKFAKENNVKTIFFEELASPKVSQTIASEIGAKTEVLDPIEGLSTERLKSGEDYFSVMRQNLKALKSALE